MTRQLLKNLEIYFKDLPNKSDRECKLLSDIQSSLEYFPVTYLHRDDLSAIGKFDNVGDIDDSDMETIADKMGSAYQDDGFWIDLDIISKHIIE